MKRLALTAVAWLLMVVSASAGPGPDSFTFGAPEPLTATVEGRFTLDGAEAQDMTTQLALFLRDLRSRTLGVVNALTSVKVTSQFYGPTGCENGAVPYSFTGDTDTGLCRPEANELELVVNGYPMINVQDQATSKPAFYLQQDVTALGADLEVFGIIGQTTTPWVVGTNANGTGTVLGWTARGSLTVAKGWTFQPGAGGTHLVPETDGEVNIGQVSGSVLRPAHIFLAGGVFSSAVQTTATSTATAVHTLVSTATNDDPTETVTQYRATTTDGVATAAATFTIPTSTSTLIQCWVVSRRTGGAAGAAEDSGMYHIEVGVKNTAGTVAEIAAETVRTIGESQAGWNVTAAASGATEIISVTGATNNNVTWHLTCRTYAVNQ